MKASVLAMGFVLTFADALAQTYPSRPIMFVIPFKLVSALGIRQ